MEKRCTVLVMRPTEEYEELNQVAEVVWIPVIRLVPRTNCSKIVLEKVKSYQVVVFTSPRTIRFIIHDAKLHGIENELVEVLRKSIIAAIGPKTANSLEEYNIKPTLVPKTYDGKHLGIELVRKLGRRSVLILRSAQGNRELDDELSKAGIKYTDVPIYDIEVNHEAAARAAKLIAKGEVDYAIFTSSSIARAVCTYLNSEEPKAVLIAIGRTTKNAIKQYCYTDRVLTPTIYTWKNIIKLLSRRCRKHGSYYSSR